MHIYIQSYISIYIYTYIYMGRGSLAMLPHRSTRIHKYMLHLAIVVDEYGRISTPSYVHNHVYINIFIKHVHVNILGQGSLVRLPHKSTRIHKSE
jgi:hypothetical protein